MHLDSDEVLHARVRAGEVEAFNVLYARYETRLFTYLLSQLRHRQDAEDVFHDTFLQALGERSATFVGEGSFRAWLYRVARNAILNRHRRGERGERARAQVARPNSPLQADDELAQHELLRELDGAVSRLPQPLSELYHLRSSGLSYEEMADVLEIPLGTLKSRMNQMVTNLREEMKSWTAR